MAELKTKPTAASVSKFLAAIPDENQRKDAVAICKMFEEVSKEKPRMWGSAIIGFGEQHIVYASGRELDWMIAGFSPRKGKTTLYLNLQGDEKAGPLLEKLGKHKTGKGCLYITRLADVDTKVLKQLIKQTVQMAK